MEQKSFDEAFADAEKSVRLRIRYVPVGDPETTGAASWSSRMYRRVGEDRKAGLLLRENIGILRQTEPPLS